ncbi:MAG: phosphodiester glycosidase family protein [Pyrinomonadaceae bacterium]|nr:phosphodiester glycosidase family protein [Pyrinomonadaceae bacterium]
MKKTSVFIGGYLWLIFFCCSISGQDFKTIQDGIEYAEMTREIDKLPVKINLLRLDLTKVRLDVVHAMDAAIGTETTSSIAKRHGAFAAVNAGFFRLDKSIFAGDAAGVLKIDGKLLSEPFGNRIALFIKNTPQTSAVEFLRFDLSQSIKLKSNRFQIDGVNRQRKDNDLILFTPEFHGTTLTDSDGLEIIVQNGKISRILDGRGSSPIPSNGFVLSVAGKLRETILRTAKVGKKINLEINGSDLKSSVFPAIIDSSYYLAEDIVGGVPQLIKNGVIEITWEQEKSSKEFVETKHPRTAVAKLKDGKFLMVTVDGRSEASGGIGLQSLAEILLELGAADAMNFDGGGSTTMFLDGKVVNKPSDKEGERKVSDAILVFPRRKN